MTELDQQTRLYQIGEFSKISRISVKALRHYHEIGLIFPSYVDEHTGYRYYSENLLGRADEIQHLKNLNFSLKEISEIFIGNQGEDKLISVIRNKSKNIHAEINRLQSIKKQLDLALTTHRVTPASKVNGINTINIPDQTIASIRFKGLYSEVGNYFKQIFKATGFQIQGKPGALYFDEGYKDQNASIECFVPVKKAVYQVIFQKIVS